MDCTCKSNASKALRDRCGVTQGILSRSRERERRFVTKRSECAGSCRREMASAIVLEAVRIYRAVTKKVIRSRWPEKTAQQMHDTRVTGSAFIDSALRGCVISSHRDPPIAKVFLPALDG